MSDREDNGELALDDIFPEPPRPPSPEPTTAHYTRPGASEPIEIRLVGQHPLWGHHLWNAARALATYIDTHPDLVRGRNVLELGAGGGLPGLVAAENDAASVVLTDYPDPALLANLTHNVAHSAVNNAHVLGYIWGHSVAPLLDVLPPAPTPRGFHLAILSDLVFNHSQHEALLDTCEHALVPTQAGETPATALVFYTHHRPHLAHRDLEFFTRARARGWTCEEVLTAAFPPMFPDDPGEEVVRSTVHGWRLTRT